MSICSSLSLAATVYGWWTKKPRALRILSIIGRVMPIGFALLSLVLLRLEFTHDSFAAYMIVANAQCESWRPILTATYLCHAILYFVFR